MNEMPLAWQKHDYNKRVARMTTQVLRRYERIAQEYHDCTYCSDPILPGDHYEGKVSITYNPVGSPNKRTELVVHKRHLPFCPKPYWESDEWIHLTEGADCSDEQTDLGEVD